MWPPTSTMESSSTPTQRPTSRPCVRSSSVCASAISSSLPRRLASAQRMLFFGPLHFARWCASERGQNFCLDQNADAAGPQAGACPARRCGGTIENSCVTCPSGSARSPPSSGRESSLSSRPPWRFSCANSLTSLPPHQFWSYPTGTP